MINIYYWVAVLPYSSLTNVPFDEAPDELRLHECNSSNKKSMELIANHVLVYHPDKEAAVRLKAMLYKQI